MDQVQIFISYAREDQERVKEFYHRLVEAGFHPWLDREHILPGMKWEPIIKAALKRADFVLVCLSATSINKRGFLQKEIKQALEHAQEKLEDDVWLIPARLDDCDVPDSLSDIQWVDLFEDDGWEQLLRAMEFQLKKLGRTLQSPQQREQVPQSTPQQVKQLPPSSPLQPKSQLTAPPVQTLPTVTLGEPELDLQVFNFITITINAHGKKVERRKGQARQFIEDLGKGVVLEMVYVPGGKFVMGADELDSEKPPHEVSVLPFFIGKYQITQEQWRIIANAKEMKITRDLDPKSSSFRGDTLLPIENITWHEAVEFCARLAKKSGRDYRLPSEAEWEYACRAGTATPFAFGDTITPDIVNYDGNCSYGNAPKGVYRKKTTPVGSFGVANAFGLYDMHGNVWEWCQDIWHYNYEGAPGDGGAWMRGKNQDRRVLRGGSWNSDGSRCRSANRFHRNPDDRDGNFGFRVVVAARTK